MESWRMIWREGFSKVLPVDGLQALAEALRTDDPRLKQGQTVVPILLSPAVRDWPVEGTCPVGFCGWQGAGAETVGGVDQFFSRACFDCDQILGEPAACRWFLNWVDDTPRDEMRRELLAEVELTLAERDAQSHQLPGSVSPVFGSL